MAIYIKDKTITKIIDYEYYKDTVGGDTSRSAYNIVKYKINDNFMSQLNIKDLPKTRYGDSIEYFLSEFVDILDEHSIFWNTRISKHLWLEKLAKNDKLTVKQYNNFPNISNNSGLINLKKQLVYNSNNILIADITKRKNLAKNTEITFVSTYWSNGSIKSYHEEDSFTKKGPYMQFYKNGNKKTEGHLDMKKITINGEEKIPWDEIDRVFDDADQAYAYKEDYDIFDNRKSEIEVIVKFGTWIYYKENGDIEKIENFPDGSDDVDVTDNFINDTIHVI